jgi:hypothetical protein
MDFHRAFAERVFEALIGASPEPIQRDSEAANANFAHNPFPI